MRRKGRGTGSSTMAMPSAAHPVMRKNTAVFVVRHANVGAASAPRAMAAASGKMISLSFRSSEAPVMSAITGGVYAARPEPEYSLLNGSGRLRGYDRGMLQIAFLFCGTWKYFRKSCKKERRENEET